MAVYRHRRALAQLQPRVDANLTRPLWVCQRCTLRRAPTFRPSQASASIPVSSSHGTIRSFSSSHDSRDSPRPSSHPDTDTDLPSSAERRRSSLSKRFSRLMDGFQTNVFLAGQRLNDLTGYSGIEALKRSIEQQEAHTQSTKQTLAAAKDAYAAAIAQRSASQREVNELLQRKHAWSAADLERFTALYRSDHANEQAEADAREELAGAEREAEETATRLGQSILARYHEEQIWSDKIRRMSTWGTWGLMGVNVLLFVVFQVAVEPWRRRRLVKGFEEKVAEAMEREKGIPEAVVGGKEVLAKAGEQESEMEAKEEAPPAARVDIASLVDSEAPERPVMAEDTAQVERQTLGAPEPKSWREAPAYYKQRFNDLFSNKTVTVKQVDLTTRALEGAFVGVAMTSIIAAIIRGR